MNKRRRLFLWVGTGILLAGMAGSFAAVRISDEMIRTAASFSYGQADAEADAAGKEAPDGRPVPGGGAPASPGTDTQDGSRPQEVFPGVKAAPGSGKAPASSAQPARPDPGKAGHQAAGSAEDSDGRGSGSGSAKSRSKDPAAIPADRAERLSGEISWSERMKITTVLLKRLQASDIKQLSLLMKDGVSREEKKKAKAIIMAKLSESEYNELIAIAGKYGLSKGKSYQQSVNE
ncbi:hypothetical protein YDYSY3_14190 [Paenibacillus chitinolyticus]|uniref:hypothetical protein n=1 Tax=Paenibacillus chitinolyticus TaxID=79263 RepID=UPI0026E4CC5D|nr:hypothetical protein [Paenibacillus chitinolyticus]GKS10419.1 hypothetical protein YDYSY3_14190 [Paenibacillus chitinolyticus]